MDGKAKPESQPRQEGNRSWGRYTAGASESGATYGGKRTSGQPEGQRKKQQLLEKHASRAHAIARKERAAAREQNNQSRQS